MGIHRGLVHDAVHWDERLAKTFAVPAIQKRTRPGDNKLLAVLGLMNEQTYAGYRVRSMPVGRCGIAGPNTWPVIEAAERGAASACLFAASSGMMADAAAQRTIIAGGRRLGDRALAAHDRCCWLADWSYLVCPDRNGKIRWRQGREARFGNTDRGEMPLILDSGGFRADLMGTSPAWARPLEHYLEAIDLIQPDGFAARDNPMDRAASVAYFEAMRCVHDHPGFWPVFSVRWVAPADLQTAPRLRSWAQHEPASLIPLNETQRRQRVTHDRLQLWATEAIAYGKAIARDPLFISFADRFGKVMIGGLLHGPVRRLARHLVAAAILEEHPDIHLWMLGCANPWVVNGLGWLDRGLFDRVSTDGTWWIADSICERLVVWQDRLLDLVDLGKRRDGDGQLRCETFLSRLEVAALALRALQAAYFGCLDFADDLNTAIQSVRISRDVKQLAMF